MKGIIVLLFLTLANSGIVHRIEDKIPTVLDTNTTIVSTLGLFRAYLMLNNCTI